MAQTQSLAKERDALKEQCAEMKMRSKQLERRVASMEEELHDAADKAAMAMEERDKLTAEKTALINTVKKLNKEVAKQKKVSAAAKAGNVVQHAKNTKADFYNYHEHLGTLEVRYATKEELKQRGFASKSIRCLNDAALRDDDEVVVCRPPKKPRTIVNIE